MAKNINMINVSGDFYLNEHLSFMCFYFHVKKTVISCYSEEDITIAMLIWEISGDKLDAYIDRRREQPIKY